MSIYGVGIDVVDIHAYAEQLELPGSSLREVFTPREQRRASNKAASNKLDNPAQHLAAVWAIKEAFIKAWSNALLGTPPVIEADHVNWQEIEVLHDHWGRPYLELKGEVSRVFGESISSAPRSLVPCDSESHTASNPEGATVCKATDSAVGINCSASHDGNISTAIVIIS